MGNRPARATKKQKDEELHWDVLPLDRALVRWLAKDLARIHDYVPANPQPIKPPDHYIEYMRLNGWLDLDLRDPDLAHLFK